MNILIVDDRPANLKLLRIVLEAEGINVCEAADGVEALGVLKLKRVDAIISDILMPRMDGYRLCMEVRANHQFCELPFIAYTATYTSDRDEKLMTDMGADRFLRKPASAAVLTATLEEVVQSKRRRPPIRTRARAEIELLKEYNERLVAKLEERNVSRETDVDGPSPLPQHSTPVEVGDPIDRKRTVLEFGLHHAVTAALAGAGTISEINQKVLAILGAGLEADIGELWTIEPDARVLHCTETWHNASTDGREFATESRHLAFASGQGLPGRVWASGQTEWCRDRINPVGLPEWIGFPIKLRHEVVGVMGFFSRKMIRRDEEHLALFDTLGLQMGQFIERQQLSEQLRQAQKMEAIGTLAGGIAHDFNNILGGIYGYCDLARMAAEGNTLVTGYLDVMMGGARRATDLVRQILEFSGQQGRERRPIQLRYITEEALRLLRATAPPAIEFQISLGHDAPVVLANATQVHQILMNLGTNAAYAMRERGGRLTVKLEDCRVDKALAATLSELRIGRYARLTVTDTGHGMDAETLGRMYEPLFTTKPPGQGTGLGLAVVRSIVRAHEGAIVASSRRGEGTTFELYFPGHLAEAEDAVSDTAKVPYGAGERILFVDDEAPLVNIGKLVLDHIGYITDTCSDAQEAIALVSADPAAYALVITDQVMPGLTGTDLAQRLKAIRPDLPIILTTGCAGTLLPDSLPAVGIRQLLVKPLSAQALAIAVHQVLSPAAE
ncbi:MAG: response regulator [Opitutaceae bacterium]